MDTLLSGLAALAKGLQARRPGSRLLVRPRVIRERPHTSHFCNIPSCSPTAITSRVSRHSIVTWSNRLAGAANGECSFHIFFHSIASVTLEKREHLPFLDKIPYRFLREIAAEEADPWLFLCCLNSADEKRKPR
ncbi:hypothetical protein B0H19DRAFT_1374049 [Mycena capillaripes]|nr:hypothetical protein B0H19DRAFT_1374049 [Mycena capillaripes]